MYILTFFFLIISSCFAGLFGRNLGFKGASLFSNFCLSFIFLLSTIIFYEVSINNCCVYIKLTNWIDSGTLNINWGFMFDSLTSVMCCIISFIAFLVHLYSIEYMEYDPHLPRFMSYLSLFTFLNPHWLTLITLNTFQNIILKLDLLFDIEVLEQIFSMNFFIWLTDDYRFTITLCESTTNLLENNENCCATPSKQIPSVFDNEIIKILLSTLGIAVTLILVGKVDTPTSTNDIISLLVESGIITYLSYSSFYILFNKLKETTNKEIPPLNLLPEENQELNAYGNILTGEEQLKANIINIGTLAFLMSGENGDDESPTNDNDDSESSSSNSTNSPVLISLLTILKNLKIVKSVVAFIKIICSDKNLQIFINFMISNLALFAPIFVYLIPILEILSTNIIKSILVYVPICLNNAYYFFKIMLELYSKPMSISNEECLCSAEIYKIYRNFVETKKAVLAINSNITQAVAVNSELTFQITKLQKQVRPFINAFLINNYSMFSMEYLKKKCQFAFEFIPIHKNYLINKLLKNSYANIFFKARTFYYSFVQSTQEFILDPKKEEDLDKYINLINKTHTSTPLTSHLKKKYLGLLFEKISKYNAFYFEHIQPYGTALENKTFHPKTHPNLYNQYQKNLKNLKIIENQINDIKKTIDYIIKYDPANSYWDLIKSNYSFFTFITQNKNSILISTSIAIITIGLFVTINPATADIMLTTSSSLLLYKK